MDVNLNLAATRTVRGEMKHPDKDRASSREARREQETVAVPIDVWEAVTAVVKAFCQEQETGTSYGLIYQLERLAVAYERAMRVTTRDYTEGGRS